MIRNIIFIIFLLPIILLNTYGQFAPPAGQPGTTAIYKDSSVFVTWATGCSVVRGYQDISNQTLGYATTGDSSMALGVAGTNGVVSLGDGGYAILTFEKPIGDATGWDFAVFENSFSDTFLELALVEVSSDGINYFRFPCTSNTQDTLQVDGFGSIDATKIDNLAGKYRALYGTPFDLQQLSGQVGLNINAITHVKIIDVVGCIQTAYATHDQFGNIINDPWSTPFASSGFDLDAVGVIHTGTTGVNDLSAKNNFIIYPNPANRIVFIQNNGNDEIKSITLTNNLGQIVKSIASIVQTQAINVSALPDGIYFLAIADNKKTVTKKLLVKHD
ncbi:MAG: T9SS type A sorting domain-containing protein [Sphingobacteriales bacterium]|jgi:hypothetical protein|nr:T9SS type A sorting domain-containing protein [Sphingobacteriales bacterium]MBK7528970.1 T9SS type A sorting domain-containing protein [Sphingobacteriales bacterium]MBK8679034.1 T9SS type A sorting domain-containing protein [Sphingobacteriales bacterium]MBL0248710.1 T9SS type A sorting domain-containing protein [Sphingobacteriales bacterium]MCC7056021.1 T9SS type A sorting domain-containing protein [Chitinophagales bacterium]